MEDRLGDLLHCEEQLRSTLHNNDKEKLRRKLALLQKEYLRTVQRLKRAERVEHVRSRITRHNSHNQTEADPKPPPSSTVEQERSKESHPDRGHTQQASPGLVTAVEKSPEKCNQAARFSLVSDSAYTPTSDSSQDSAQVPKSSPALRRSLRSRRSRLRWAKRSAQPDPATSNDQEKSRDGEGKRFTDPPALHESEELFSQSENESPSLLLPHWNLQGHVQKEELLTEKGIDMVLNREEITSNSQKTNKCFRSHSHKHLRTLNDCAEDVKVEKEETTKQQLDLDKGDSLVSNSEEILSKKTSLRLEAKDFSPHKDYNDVSLEVQDVYKNGKQTKAETEETANQQRSPQKVVTMVSNSEENLSNFGSSLFQSEYISTCKDDDTNHSKLAGVYKNGKHQVEETKVGKEEAANQQLSPEKVVGMVSNSEEKSSNVASLRMEAKASPFKDDSNICSKFEDVCVKGKHRAEDIKMANQQQALEKELDAVSNSEENLSNFASLRTEAKGSLLKDDNNIQSKLEDVRASVKHRAGDTKTANQQLSLEKVVGMVSNSEGKSSNFASLRTEAKGSSFKDDNSINNIHSKLEDVCANGKHRLEDTKTANQQQALGIDMVSNCEEKLSNFAETERNKMETQVSLFTDSCKMSSKLDDVHENGKQTQIQTSTSLLNTTEVKVDKTEPEDGGQRLLDSCTLVDGLLFPAEYYVRTTRRMSVSQSQPDMNAVILSHLHKGRQRRGRGRRLNRTVSEDLSVLEASKGISGSNSPSSCEFSLSLDVGSVSATPSRGRRGRRGRGRGRRKENMKEIVNKTQTMDFFVALSRPKCDLTSKDPESEEVQPKCGVVNADIALEDPQTLNVQENDPKVLQTHQSQTNDAQEKAAPADWPSLLLPSSSQSYLPSLSPLPPSSLLQTLLRCHIRHFHLPDDQFGSLKLLKLRQIISGVEQLVSASGDTSTTTDFHTHSPPLSSVPLTPTPEAELASPNHKANKIEDNVEVLNHEKHFGCSSSTVLNAASSEPECKNVASNLLHLKPQIDSQYRISALNVTPLEKDGVVKDTASLPENEAQNPESWNADSQCSRELERDREIPPKNSSAFDNSPQIFQNIPTKTEKLECEDVAERRAPSQLLLSPSHCSASCPLALPLVGFTPLEEMPEACLEGLASPLSPPILTPPPAHSASSEALDPPVLSPYPALRPLPLTPPAHPSPGPQETRVTGTALNQQKAGREETTDDTCTLKAGSRGSLVDMCCVCSSSGSVSVATAGTKSVSVWRQEQSGDWTLTHTWSCQEPVLRVFPVPDTPDLLCLILGQLEITQVRVLSCSTLAQTVLCSRVAHTVISAPKSRVICCCHSSASSSLQVHTLSERSPPQAQTLVAPGGLLSSVAPVEGLPDALIGMDQSGSLFIWNVETGRLLKKLTLGPGLSHSACLRGYSTHGALFVLLQHHFLGLDAEEEGKEEEEESVFSLVAANPKNGKSAVATALSPPHGWSGRLAGSDVLGSRVLGLSQKGRVCVWDLEHPRDPRPVCAAPGGRGWQLARWGSPGVLLTARRTGEVTLHRYTHGTTTAIATLRHPD